MKLTRELVKYVAQWAFTVVISSKHQQIVWIRHSHGIIVPVLFAIFIFTSLLLPFIMGYVFIRGLLDLLAYNEGGEWVDDGAIDAYWNNQPSRFAPKNQRVSIDGWNIKFTQFYTTS